jgi:hypothetical protein
LTNRQWIPGQCRFGWNAGVVGASVMLIATLPAAVRPHGEGLGEAAMGLAGATGAPAAGVVAGAGSFATLGTTAAAVATLTLLALPGGRRRAGQPRADYVRQGGRA